MLRINYSPLWWLASVCENLGPCLTCGPRPSYWVRCLGESRAGFSPHHSPAKKDLSRSPSRVSPHFPPHAHCLPSQPLLLLPFPPLNLLLAGGADAAQRLPLVRTTCPPAGDCAPPSPLATCSHHWLRVGGGGETLSDSLVPSPMFTP